MDVVFQFDNVRESVAGPRALELCALLENTPLGDYTYDSE